MRLQALIAMLSVVLLLLCLGHALASVAAMPSWLRQWDGIGLAHDPRLMERLYDFTGLHFDAVFSPSWGYYSLSRGGVQEDFQTIPVLFNTGFGAVIADRMVQLWWYCCASDGPREHFHIFEFGANKGVLAESILRRLHEVHPQMYDIVRYHAIEVNKGLASQSLLKNTLHVDGGRFTAHAPLDARNVTPFMSHDWMRETAIDAESEVADGSRPVTGIVVTNELVDAFEYTKVRVSFPPFPSQSFSWLSWLTASAKGADSVRVELCYLVMVIRKKPLDHVLKSLGKASVKDEVPALRQLVYEDSDWLKKALNARQPFPAPDDHVVLSRSSYGHLRDAIARGRGRWGTEGGTDPIESTFIRSVHTVEVYFHTDPAHRPPELARWLVRSKKRLRETSMRAGGRPVTTYANLRIRDFMKVASAVLDRGYAIHVDYGFDGHTFHLLSYENKLFRTYSKSESCQDSPYACPGAADLTVDVDMTDLAEVGAEEGFPLLHYSHGSILDTPFTFVSDGQPTPPPTPAKWPDFAGNATLLYGDDKAIDRFEDYRTVLGSNMMVLIQRKGVDGPRLSFPQYPLGNETFWLDVNPWPDDVKRMDDREFARTVKGWRSNLFALIEMFNLSRLLCLFWLDFYRTNRGTLKPVRGAGQGKVDWSKEGEMAHLFDQWTESMPKAIRTDNFQRYLLSRNFSHPSGRVLLGEVSSQDVDDEARVWGNLVQVVSDFLTGLMFVLSIDPHTTFDVAKLPPQLRPRSQAVAAGGSTNYLSWIALEAALQTVQSALRPAASPAVLSLQHPDEQLPDEGGHNDEL
ncbi:unnamed protein product [Vitrella brassicaformis CCMP3155]|uniref:type II protein arginine methyltransferase n=3 Tax=Vitrella brassicaformis TaxID=1169539 RepID=A0A0G4FUJ2_VITBC|nr:unnamed protein product [Vitrella brassicaformis CCMP3155]|eukprot:CEM18611.1 unnamed protein product [Vitrella brassicaformis CCMP3155]